MNGSTIHYHINHEDERYQNSHASVESQFEILEEKKEEIYNDRSFGRIRINIVANAAPAIMKQRRI